MSDTSASEPLGWFHPVRTRDAVAYARSGWPYFEINLKGLNHRGEIIYEIRFVDDEWMLVTVFDLRHSSPTV